jgi:uncharacterized OsmC-like protein
MSDFTFQMLLECRYTGDKNAIDQLNVEHLVDDEWQKLDLDIHSPGFDIFMYAILTCQHMYFKNNASEYGLVLDSSEGLITVIADDHRSIESLHVEFKSKLKKGEATDDVVNAITARMQLCPVSLNLKHISDSKIAVSFESA